MASDTIVAVGPPSHIRLVGRTITWLTAHVPGAWRILKRPQARFFDKAAPGWGAATGDASAPLTAALDALAPAPRKILDVGTGRGRAARELARRFPDAQVLGIDVSPEMIRLADVPGELAGRLRFAATDLTDLDETGFDLVTHVNVPALFKDVARVAAPGALVLFVTTFGPATPYFTPHATLRKGLEKSGFEPAGEGETGGGTWFAAEKR